MNGDEPQPQGAASTIKCCWRTALLPGSTRGLPRSRLAKQRLPKNFDDIVRRLTVEQYNELTAQIERWSFAASKMLRRASILLAYSVAREDDPSRVGDLRKTEPGYWRKLLRVGCFLPRDIKAMEDEKRAGRSQPQKKTAKKDPPTPIFPNQAIQDAYGDIQDNLDRVNVVDLHDQVLTYTATCMSTAVTNCLVLPFIQRLERIVKSLVCDLDLKTDVSSWDVNHAVRDGDVPDAWPEAYRALVDDVRTRLGVVAKEHVYDDYAETCDFGTLFRFYKWMQGEFDRMGRRQIKFTPLFKVRRQHIRLDRKLLLQLLLPFVRKDDRDMLRLNELEVEQRVLMEGSEKKRTAHNPKRDLPKVPKAPADKLFKTDPARHELLLNEHKEALVRYKAAKDDAGHRTMQAVYEEWIALGDKIIFSFFHLPRRLKRPGKGRVLSPSIVTDGVSASFTVSAPGAIKGKYQAAEPDAPKKPPKRRGSKRKREDDAPVGGEYDLNLSTTVNAERKVAVVGMDPGRANIVSVGMLLKDEVKDSKVVKFRKTLSRGQYYHEIGEARTRRLRAKWLAEVEGVVVNPEVDGLLDESVARGEDELEAGGAMRTSDPAAMREYVRSCACKSGAWWDARLRRREARLTLGTYIRKRSVLDGFFSRVKRAVQSTVKRHCGPGYDVHVAYGQAGPTMASTGKGERAVPTKGAAGSCFRAFGAGNCRLVWEHNTTKLSWKGSPRGCVYRVPLDGGGTRLAHTVAKCPPVVQPAHMDAYDAQHGFVDGVRDKQGRPHYDGVRGLRFCPEVRNYVDRDAVAAETIGKLGLLEILGLPRPFAFCRPANKWGASSEPKVKKTRAIKASLPTQVFTYIAT